MDLYFLSECVTPLTIVAAYIYMVFGVIFMIAFPAHVDDLPVWTDIEFGWICAAIFFAPFTAIVLCVAVVLATFDALNHWTPFSRRPKR